MGDQKEGHGASRDLAHGGSGALEWRDITSAPRDGRPVLVGNPAWSEASEARYFEDDDGWWLAGTHPTDATDGQCYPTMWTPLPSCGGPVTRTSDALRAAAMAATQAWAEWCDYDEALWDAFGESEEGTAWAERRRKAAYQALELLKTFGASRAPEASPTGQSAERQPSPRDEHPLSPLPPSKANKP